MFKIPKKLFRLTMCSVLTAVYSNFRLKTKLKYGSLLATDGENARQDVAQLDQLQQEVIDLEVIRRRLQRRVNTLHEHESLFSDKQLLIENTSLIWPGR
jgi:hypothetical protein